MKPSKFPTFRALIGATGRGLKKLRRPTLILLLILAVAHAGLNIYASVLLNRELAQVRQTGEPLVFSKLAPPPVAAAQNAAPLYRRAYAARSVSRPEEAERWPKSWPFGIAEGLSDSQLRALLTRNQAAISLARQAAARPEYRSDINWKQASPTQILFPHYGEMRAVARLLGAQAIQEAHDAQNEMALRDVWAMYRMSDHLKTEPTMMSFLVSNAINTLADRTLGEVLKVRPLSAQRAQKFEASLPRTDWSAFFRSAFIGERAINLWVLESSRSDPVTVYHELQIFFSGESNSASAFLSRPVPDWVLKPLSIVWSPFLKLDELYFLRLWKQRLAALQPIQEPLGQVDPLLDFADKVPNYAVLTRLLFPVFGRAYNHRDSTEVARRQREITLAISAFRAAHNNTYPTTLKEAATAWKGTLPLDPYDDKPFNYRSDGQSFTLYSIGPNRVDDHGRNGERESISSVRNAELAEADDLVWNFKR